MPLRVNKSLIPEAVNLDKNRKFPLSTNMSRPRTARLDLMNGKLLVKKNNLFY